MNSILLVDDDDDSRDVVSRYLAKAGLVVRPAANGREALMALATALPDVILLDLHMPEMDGVAFLEVVRNYLRWSTVPIVLLTGYPDVVPLERLHHLGVKMIFVKTTYRLEDLLDCVRRLAADPTSRCDRSGGIGA